MPNVPINITINDGGAKAQIDKIGASLSNLGASAQSGAAATRAAFMSTFASLEQQAQAFRSAAGSGFSQVAASANSAASSVKSSFGSSFTSLKSQITSTLSGISTQANSTSNSIKNSFNGLESGLDGTTKAVNRLFTALAGGTAITVFAMALKGLVTSSYEVSNALFGAQNALRAVTGSSKEAADGMSFVKSEALRLGLDVTNLATAYSKLTASAEGSGLAGKQIRDVLSSVSETAAVLGLNTQQVEGAFLALSQMMSKGKVQAEELRGQLGEHLPGAFNIAAKAMGVTTAELDKMLKKGQITAAELLTNLPQALRNAYGEGLPAALQRSSVAFGRLKTEAQLLGQEIGDAMEPAGQALARLGSALVGLFSGGEAKAQFKSFGEFAADVINNITVAILSFKYGLVMTLGAIDIIWSTFWFTARTSALGMFGALKVGFTALVGPVQGIMAELEAIWNGTVNIFKETWAGLISVVAAGADKIGQTDLATNLRASAAEIRSNVVPAYAELKEKIAQIKAQSAERVESALADSVSAIHENAVAYVDHIAVVNKAIDLAREERDANIANVFSTKQETAAKKELIVVNRELGYTKKQLAEFERAYKQLQEQSLGVFMETRTAQEKYLMTLQEYDTLLQAGTISQDTYNRAVGNAKGEFEKAAKASGEMALTVNDFLTQGLEGTKDALEQVFFDPFHANIKSVETAFLNSMKKMAAETLANKALDFLKTSLGLGTPDPKKQNGRPIETSAQAGAPGIGNKTGIKAVDAVLDGALLSETFKKATSASAPILGKGITDGTTTAKKTLTETVVGWGTNIADTFKSGASSVYSEITGAFSEGGGGLSKIFSDSFAGLGNMLSSLMSSISGAGSSGGASGGSGWAGVAMQVASLFSAQGNVFQNGNVTAFAQGGVVTSPTNFAMTGGRMGLMGEAGPEAIMPLKRNAKGDLGIANHDGGGGGTITINLGIEEGIILKTMDSAAGGKVIVNRITKDAGSVKGALR